MAGTQSYSSVQTDWKPACCLLWGMRAILFSFLITVSVFAADFDAGLTAYRSQDYATAMQNWLPLAEQGAPHAQYNVGLMYAHGYGVRQDLAQAAQWYRKSAEQGVVEAQFNLGLLYSDGEGVSKDPGEARKWLSKAAEQGDKRATNALANLYADDGQQSETNSEALKWYQQAAEKGVASAQFELGVMYDVGRGVPSSFPDAEKWYRQAAEQGYGPALTNLGVLYYNGQGEKRDLVLAHEYFLLGQMHNDPRASNLLESTTNKLTKKQMKRAAGLAQEWMNAHNKQAEITDARDPNASSASAPPQSPSSWGRDPRIGMGSR
jgi:TPR repeat protein